MAGRQYRRLFNHPEIVMSRIAVLGTLAFLLGACTRESPTTPIVGSDAPLAKGGSSQSASLAWGFVATSIAVRDLGSTTIRLTSVAGFNASIALANTQASAPGACVALGDPAETAGLESRLVADDGPRTKFIGNVNLAAIGSASWVHQVAVHWTEGSRSYYVTIGQTTQSDGPFPNQYPTVTQAGNVYTYSGGTVTVRVNYNKTKNASLVCPNLDIVDLSFPLP
jgi:hypothetical protein